MTGSGVLVAALSRIAPAASGDDDFEGSRLTGSFALGVHDGYESVESPRGKGGIS